MHIGFKKKKRKKDHGIFNPKGKTSMHSSDINVEYIKRAIYSHTFLKPINHFPDCSPPCFTNSSIRPLQFLEYLLVT